MFMVTPLKINMEPKNGIMEVWKMSFLFNWVIFGFYVNFQECNVGKYAIPVPWMLWDIFWGSLSLFWFLWVRSKQHEWRLDTKIWLD